jgi:hypothetical protein
LKFVAAVNSGESTMTIRVVLAVTFLLFTVACNVPLGSPNAEKIKADLIGKQTPGGFGGWRFESLSEFESFKITETNSSGDVIEYKVDARLKDVNTGNRYTANLLINYRKENGEWKLIHVTDGGSLKSVK